MTSKPTHIAYVVKNPPEGSDEKAMWRPIGADWTYKKGFDVVIHEQISVSGRFTCIEAKETTAE